MNAIETQQLSIGYGDLLIVKDLNLQLPAGKITSIIGANGCGKSTILKTIARVLEAQSGKILVEARDIKQIGTGELAKRMAVLPQSPQAPRGLTVEELVAYGRFPYQKGFGKLTAKDKALINWSLEETGLIAYKARPIEALSGGQRQRAWIAMALVQETPILVLDEPTTYLDLAHQLDVFELLERLNKEKGHTIVMVVHEINMAARFSDYMVGVKAGQVVCTGSPKEVMTPKHLRELFEIEARVILEESTGKPVCVSYDRMISQKGKKK